MTCIRVIDKITSNGRYIVELRELVESQVDSKGLDEEEQRDKLKKVKDRVYHELGLTFFEESLKKNIEELLEDMCQNHIHILSSGELETLLIPFGINYTHNKSKWAVDAINKITELKKDTVEQEKSIVDFLRKVIN